MPMRKQAGLTLFPWNAIARQEFANLLRDLVQRVVEPTVAFGLSRFRSVAHHSLRCNVASLP